MKKNVIWWPAVINEAHKDKYGSYEYFQYSRNTWEYWCRKNDCLFVPFEVPVEEDLKTYRVNWQKAIFLFDELERMGIEYDQIALVDSSFMIRWDAPNFFELTDRRFTAFRDTDNLKWVYDSVQGYKNIFDDFKLDIGKYVNSGFMIFNEQHKELFQGFKRFYLDNIAELCKLQDEVVKKGTEQTPMNYWLQVNDVDVKIDLPLPFKLTHLHRKDMFSYNWQLNEDKTPFIIKYGYNYSFNGIPKDQRTQLMQQTWDFIKDNYKDKKIMYEDILNEVKHKDTAKYTTSRKFKTDILETFLNDDYKDKTILELGTSQGMSTRMLSYVFKKVVTVEWDDWNIEQAKKHCEGRDNIEFIKTDLYGEEWNLPEPDVVFIDAGHTYDNVKSDIENCVKHFDKPIFVFDDYGLPPGAVKNAIDEKVKEGVLTIDKFIGEKPEDLVHAAGTKFFDMEGVICNMNKNTQYDILGFCSENYKACYDFSIESWLATKARKIYIYTDGWEDDTRDGRIEFIDITEKDTSWINNVGKKLDCILDYWDRDESVSNFCFLDVDNYITSDISEIFEKNKTLGLTRIDMQGKTVSAGNVFVTKNKISKRFLNDWKNLQEDHRVNKDWSADHWGVAYDQTSLHDLTMQDINGPNQYKIMPLDGRVYNCEHTHNGAWMDLIRNHKSKILHFKAKKWQDEKLVEDIKQIVEEQK